jgi:WD40 repeat protein
MKPITTLGYVNALVNDIAFSPDGKYLGVTDSDGYIKVWDLKTKEKIVDMLHTDAPGEDVIADGILFTNNPNYLITSGGYWDSPKHAYTTTIWNFPNMEIVREYTGDLASGGQFQISPNDSLLTVITPFYLHMLRLNYNPSSIKKKEYENDTLIIPNPIKDLLTIEFEVPFSKNTQIKIYDTAGLLMELLSSNDLPITSYTLTYNCSHLPAGKYFITIEQDDFFKTYSFVKL